MRITATRLPLGAVGVTSGCCGRLESDKATQLVSICRSDVPVATLACPDGHSRRGRRSCRFSAASSVEAAPGREALRAPAFRQRQREQRSSQRGCRSYTKARSGNRPVSIRALHFPPISPCWRNFLAYDLQARSAAASRRRSMSGTKDMDSTDAQRLGSMTAGERRAAIGLAAIFGSRMLGLFIILPVFSVYADQLAGSTPALIGLAIGAYGLSQAILQIPFGLASDRFGRRPVIAAGLLLFVAGSVVAALSTHIYGVILGRVIQGSGAISAAVMALAADLTRDSQRTKIMAIIGISVGGAFMLALVLGPLVAGWGGLSGVFWITALLAVLAVVLLLTVVPGSDVGQVDATRTGFGAVLRNPALLRLNGGIFALHLILTAGFVVLP